MTSDEDQTVISLLQGAGLPVYDGHVEDSDSNEKTISAPLPYAVFYATPGTDQADALSGKSGRHLGEFRVTSVGETREQAQLAGEKITGVLNRQFISFPGGPRFVRRTDNNAPVARDDTWTRPDGGPLFLRSDQFAVLI